MRPATAFDSGHAHRCFRSMQRTLQSSDGSNHSHQQRNATALTRPVLSCPRRYEREHFSFVTDDDAATPYACGHARFWLSGCDAPPRPGLVRAFTARNSATAAQTSCKPCRGNALSASMPSLRLRLGPNLDPSPWCGATASARLVTQPLHARACASQTRRAGAAAYTAPSHQLHGIGRIGLHALHSSNARAGVQK